MKIAVAADEKFVSSHFGHCQGFLIYDIENNKISNKIFLENPGHSPGFLPKYLKEQNVDVVISGGMGSRALQLLEQYNIDVVIGAHGTCDEVAALYLKGKLKSKRSACREHGYKDRCHDE